jgi:hypothetical protein
MRICRFSQKQRREKNIKGENMKAKICIILVFLPYTFINVNSISIEKTRERMGPVQKSDDVVVISNPKTPKNPSMRIVFKEDLSIGVIEGDENYMFGKRVYFNADEEGNFYVTDWDRKRIQKYDPEGKYILTIGREGQGPGEFKNVWRPEIDKDKNMYAVDIANYRISFFDKDGKYLRDMRFPSISVSSNLFIYSRGLFITTISKSLEEQGGAKWTDIFGLFDDKFNLIAEIHKEVHEMRTPSGRGDEALAQNLANIVSDIAFKPSVSYMLTQGDFIYFGYPEKYKIKVYSSAGKLIKVIQREYAPLEVSGKDKEDFIKIQEAEFFRFLPPRANTIKKKVIQLIDYPKYKPAYNNFTLMDNGWLVVIVDSISGEYTLFDIFDKEGKYIAQFMANIPTEGLFFKNGKAYALATTEEGYKFVKRYSCRILGN